MGNTTSDELQTKLHQGRHDMAILKHNLLEQQEALFNDLKEKGFLKDPTLNMPDDEVKFEICQKLIYVRIADYLATLKPIKVKGITYVLGMIANEEVVDDRTNAEYTKESVCSLLADIVFAKLDLWSKINDTLTNCDNEYDQVKASVKRKNKESLNQFTKYYKEFKGEYSNLISQIAALSSKLRFAIDINEINKLQRLILSLLTKFELNCAQFNSNVRRLP